MNRLKWLFFIVSYSLSLNLSVAHAADDPCCSIPLPAVSQPNAWTGLALAYLRNEQTSGGGGIVEAGAAAPLGPLLGAQLHTYGGYAGQASLVSADAYFFWRDPYHGLLGSHVLYTQSNGYHHAFYGLHGEGYLNNLNTLVLEGGTVNRNDRHADYYAEAIAHWYVNRDWRLYLGGITVGGDVAGQTGTEYQFSYWGLPSLSAFADIGVGSHNLKYGFLGLRYYIAAPKALVCRHRMDMVLPTLDPIDRVKH